ncbi:osmotically inducible lipoprotein OsmE [Arthrobacter alpinus]|uniref:Osmotically inducible lipoprotein OsmE n=1 Tax=Arthrobacter alpinus TaxID=656366 RepID=A0A1H5PF01_9MICC|nr:hypothetical protein [Arthrobacter alpinus]SEF12445.1 osmotically inducible lipoprotein OsmE [Arthrobacter alpinus]
MNSRSVAVTAILLLFAAPSLSGCSLFDPQVDLTLHDVVNAEYDAPDVTTQAEGITDTACVSPRNCVEAYSTAEADYFRFDTRKRADEYGSSVKDGFVVNYIVMDFEGKNASVEMQLWAMQALAGMWNDYEGDFPDRG